MEAPSIITLRDTIHTHNYAQAFDAAHALKGLSGNLRITEFYNAIQTLTDALRNEGYRDLEEEYAEVEREHDRLKRIVSGEPMQADAPESPPYVEWEHAFSLGIRSLMEDKNNRLCVSIGKLASKTPPGWYSP